MENEDYKGTEAYIRDINELFDDPVSYLIPQFQRPYAWKENEQWMPLWEDVRAVAEDYLKKDVDKVKPHFLGAIVLQSRGSKIGVVKKILVVDGQQRLTTLQLLIKATQQIFQQMDDLQRVNRLGDLTENPSNKLENDPTNWTKIRQSNFRDQEAFQKAIRGDFIEEQGKHWAITQSLSYFKKSVHEWLHGGTSDASARAEALEKTLTEYIKIAVIDLDKDEKPHVIFETLNARGEPLTQSDLVKNVVMYEANVVDDARKASELWGMFDGEEWWRRNTAEPQLKRIQMDRFLNHWMIMKTQKSVAPERVASGFRSYLKSVEGPNTALDIEPIAQEIRTSGKIYKEIMEGKEDLLGHLFLERMRAIGIMGSITPFLLWLRKPDVPSDHLKRCIQVLESYLVRRRLYGSGSQGLSGLFIELLQKTYQESPQHYVTTIAKHLDSKKSDGLVWPNDRMLLEHINRRPMPSNAPRRQMVLKAIELALRGDMAEQIDWEKKLTIEHIMPQKWGVHWPLPTENSSQENVERRNESVDYLGNLTLTTGKLNASISNGPWNEKQEALDKHSTLFLNKDLLSSAPQEWNEDTIRERTDRLAQKIIQIWKPAECFIETSDSLGHS